LSLNASQQPVSGQISHWRLFSAIVSPMFLGMVGETIVATALPIIAASLGNVERIAWVVVAYLITLAVMAPIYGRLGDAFGRRRMMVVALILAMLGSILCALSTSIEMLIGARILQGLGGGGLISLSHALIGQSVPPRDRARFHGYVAAVGFGASALGPVLGGLLTDAFGWRSIFLANLPLAALGLVMIFRLPGRTTPIERFRFDVPGVVLFVVFVWAFLIVVETVGQPAAGNTPFVVSLAAAALVSLLLLVWRERKATDPLFPPPLFANPTIWRCDALALCHGAHFVALLTLTPIYLRVVRDLSAAEIGLLMSPVTAGIGIGTFMTGQIVGRTGRSAIFPSVGLVGVFVFIVVLALLSDVLSNGMLSLLLGLIAFCMGTVMSVVQVTVQSEAGPKYLGTSVGVISLARALGGAIGTAFAGALLFAILATGGLEISNELQAVLQGTGSARDLLGAAAEARIRGDVAFAFRWVFLLIASYSAIACLLAWTVPRRTI